ncbi:MAG: HEAT repeat domain-containing protein [Pseudomonadota bacterium]
MSEEALYRPASDFLCIVINGEVPLAGGEFAEQNLARLIEYTSDEDDSNRDWATLLLAQLELDRADVVEALLRIADDKNQFVRGEAILGLANLGHQDAFTLVHRELENEFVQLQVFEAAKILADSRLLEHLKWYQDATDEPAVDDAARAALKACQKRGSKEI